MKITVLGAGLVGSLLAILFKQKGYEVTVYERRPDMRKEAISAGRSINFALSHRGWKALSLAGLEEEIRKIAIPMPGRFLHQDDGSSAFQAYGKNGEAIYSVSRGDLNKKLLDAAENAGVQIIFNYRCIHVDVDQNIITLDTKDGEIQKSCELLIGADGAFSSLRTAYSMLDRTNFSQHYLKHGYKELHIPPGEGNTWQIEKHALHIWPRHNYMMIALPNEDGSFTCTLFFPFEGELSFETVNNDESILKLFKTHFPDALPLMPQLLNDYHKNPTSSLITVKLDPWYYQNKSFVIGDAAHAIVPFYGQGLNAGFEDLTVLNELMEKYSDDWTQILPAYHQARKEEGDAIAELAYKNFIEMRDLVADPVFLKRKKVEKELGRRYPNVFNSVYEMVSFSHVPYSKALKSTKAQDVLWSKIYEYGGDFFEHLNDENFIKILDGWMEQYAVDTRQ